MSPATAFLRLACLLSFLLATLVSSQSTLTTTSTVSSATGASSTASSSYNVFSAIASNSPHNGATGSTDDPDNSEESNEEGSSGSSEGAFNLSTGAIIAISVIAGTAVVVGIGSAILFYISKKRQWELRERLRQSARKVAKAITPRRAAFAQSDVPFRKDGPSSNPANRDKRGMVRIDAPPPGKFNSRGAREYTTRGGQTGILDSNLEKGFGTRTTVEAVGNMRESSGTPPKSTFDMDSPVERRGKGWPRLFGKR